MNILIVGYGKMGHIVEQVAQERGHKISAIIDEGDSWEKVKPEETDVAIEFSTPATAVDNIKACLERQIPIVVGTTGWYEQIDEVKKLVAADNGSLLYSSNFAIGVFLFRKVNVFLAKLMSKYTGYEPSITEIHHIHKKDAPSGTAITLANEIIECREDKTSWRLGEKQSENELSISSIRQGEEFGTHKISYSSTEDTIEIEHKAKSRRGLALGAVLSAEFLKNKKGVYTMNDMIEEG